METVVALALRLGVAMTADIRAEAAKRLFEAFIILIDDRIRRYKETVEGGKKRGSISESMEGQRRLHGSKGTERKKKMKGNHQSGYDRRCK